MRGKFDPRYHSTVYIYMLQQVRDNRTKVELTLNLLNSLFDSAKVSSQGYMGRDVWLITYTHLQSLMTLLDSPQLKESLKFFVQREATQQQEQTLVEDMTEDQLTNTGEIEKSIMPALSNFLEKLDFELLKAYQNLNHTKVEYL